MRRESTAIEQALRHGLRRIGLEGVTQHRIDGLRARPDLAWPDLQVAVFIDGCFWHGCPRHGTWPKTNADWWRAKIEGNRARDVRTDEALATSGWIVVRACQRTPPSDVMERLVDALRARGWAEPESPADEE